MKKDCRQTVLIFVYKEGMNNRMTAQEEKALGLQNRIGYKFKNPRLLIEALTHSSYINERKLNRTDCYERLEFLGDAVLETVSSEFLFNIHTEATEGELSKHRASLVCETRLAESARRIGIGEYILLGKGERLCKGYDKPSILADVTEAVIGAVFLDAGFEQARKLILESVLIDREMSDYRDSKSALQELVQSKGTASIVYETIEEIGPDHNKEYTVKVMVNGEEYGIGKGTSKKNAELKAAEIAIKNIE